MANFTITIPDGQVGRVVDAFAIRFNWAEQGGGLTKAQFAREQLMRFVKSVTHGEELRIAQEQVPQPQPVDVT